jgi:uncharacterized glyoxalase superfamily protein PhnB
MSPAIDSRELARVAPELFVPDVERPIRFYVGSLSFELFRREEADGKATFAVVAGARIARDIGDRYYGLRDFIVEDSNGYRPRFASPRSP